MWRKRWSEPLANDTITLERLRAMEPADAAATWAVRRSEGASDAEFDAFEDWLLLSTANTRAWESVRRAWDCFELADDDVLSTLRREALRMGGDSRRHRTHFALAASVLVLIGGAALMIQPWGSSPGQPATEASTGNEPTLTAYGAVDHATGVGERASIALSDGSRVTLDSASAIDIAFNEERRGIRLAKGRAFFDVGRDRRRFVVEAAGSEIVAFGTEFDVRIDADRLQVTLVEGKVSVARVASRSPAYTLEPGEQLVLDAGGRTTVSKVNLESALSWQRGFETFDNDTLAHAVAELNRHTTEQLVIRDPEVAELRVSGMFRTGDSSRFADAVALVHPVRIVRVAPNRLEIVRDR